MKTYKRFPLQILVISITFILALAMMDYAVFHLGQGPEGLYKYWLALTLVVIVFSFAMTYAYWLGSTKKMVNPYIIPGIFFTVILLLIAGVLDIFYFLLTRKHGEPYSFEVWSAQYKWFGFWNWNLQVVWSTFFILLIFLMWYLILKKTKTGMIKHA